jgi:hypothetical protein
VLCKKTAVIHPVTRLTDFDFAFSHFHSRYVGFNNEYRFNCAHAKWFYPMSHTLKRLSSTSRFLLSYDMIGDKVEYSRHKGLK